MPVVRKSWWILGEIALFALVMFVATPAIAGDGEVSRPWYAGFTPILLLLGAIAIVIWRLPAVKEEYQGQLAHLKDNNYRIRRALNWLALGATYAFLYWGRYNLNVAVRALGGEEVVADFNWMFGVGTAIYGVSFLINGPLTDKFGGRFSILMGACGAAIANILMGVVCWMSINGKMETRALFWWILVLYSINMYFQSFGAVAIVKCNAAWFHLRERGVFGAIFGILISLGIYFAYDWSRYIVKDLQLPVYWAFFAPAAALAVMFIIDYFVARDLPSEAGLKDIETGVKKGKPDHFVVVFKKMMHDPVIMAIACIEFCSGFLRQAIMQIFPLFAASTGGAKSFAMVNWGMLLCVAGILGGVFAGTISDRVFQSRRGPVSAVLYIGMLLGSVGMCFLFESPYLWPIVIMMSLCVIGVHGMLSGTASMEFAGANNTGIAVGLIDGFVYMGTALQAILYKFTLPEGGKVASDVSEWWFWPVAMVPMACVGLVLSYHIRNKRPEPCVAQLPH